MVNEQENENFLKFLENKKINNSKLENELIDFLIDNDNDALQICKDIYNYGLDCGLWLCYNIDVINLIKRNFELFFITLQEVNTELYENKLNIELDNFFKMYCIVYEYINSNLLNEYESIEN